MPLPSLTPLLPLLLTPCLALTTCRDTTSDECFYSLSNHIHEESWREKDVSPKDPHLTCRHGKERRCHYTYVTAFTPVKAINETVRACHIPVEKVCNGQGEEECTLVHQASCSTTYRRAAGGGVRGQISCKRTPLKLCGAGCRFVEGAEECREEVEVREVEVPVEVCDLVPGRRCAMVTRLSPHLRPVPQCTPGPSEGCARTHGRGVGASTPTHTSSTTPIPTSTTSFTTIPPTTTQQPPTTTMNMAEVRSLPRLPPQLLSRLLPPQQQPPFPLVPNPQPNHLALHRSGDEGRPVRAGTFIGTYGVTSMLSDNVRRYKALVVEMNMVSQGDREKKHWKEVDALHRKELALRRKKAEKARREFAMQRKEAAVHRPSLTLAASHRRPVLPPLSIDRMRARRREPLYRGAYGP